MSQQGKVLERERIRLQQVDHIVRGMIRIRVVLVPVVACIVTVITLIEPTPWRVGVLASVLFMLAGIGVYDAVRLRHDQGPFPSNHALELALGILLQTGLIWITGAVESPLLVIFIPMAMISGIALGTRLSRWWLLLLLFAVLWLMALSGLLGWVPQATPTFFGLGQGYYNRPTYVLIKIVLFMLVLLIASHIGSRIHLAVLRMLDQALGAKQQALDVLADRNHELVQLSSTIAHELKNPLASVQGLVQLLERGSGDPERQASRVQVLKREIARMRTILDELLNFSRPLGDLSLREVDPAEVVQELTSLHEGIIRARRIQVEVPEVRDLTFQADPRKVRQALTNLLQNALEATLSGGTVEWIMEMEPADGSPARILLGVKDTGPGLSPEVRDRVARVGISTKPGGSGIGLAVARSIAEQHGGELSVRDRQDGKAGCEALLRLPLSPPPPPVGLAAGKE